jgi:hypothetical protein
VKVYWLELVGVAVQVWPGANRYQVTVPVGVEPPVKVAESFRGPEPTTSVVGDAVVVSPVDGTTVSGSHAEVVVRSWPSWLSGVKTASYAMEEVTVTAVASGILPPLPIVTNSDEATDPVQLVPLNFWYVTVPEIAGSKEPGVKVAVSCTVVPAGTEPGLAAVLTTVPAAFLMAVTICGVKNTAPASSARSWCPMVTVDPPLVTESKAMW